MENTHDYNAVATVDIQAPINKVWDGISKPEIIKQYMHDTEVETDWQVGSSIQWKGVWNNKPYQDKGVVLAYEPTTHLRYTHWSPLSGVEDKPENYHTVSIDLSEHEGSTRLVLTQSNNASQEAADNMAQNGWLPMLQTLKSILEQQPR